MRPNLIFIVLIIAALIASGFFVINYFKKSTTAAELGEQIVNANIKIQEFTISSENLSKEMDDLKIRQTTIKNTIISENTSIPSMTNSNEVIRNIMKLGLRNDTNVIPLKNSGWADLKIPQGNYQVLKLNLTIEAMEYNIINFVRGLQDLYPTLVIESLRIHPPVTIQTADSGIPNETATNEKIQSNLVIAIYSG